MADTSRSRAVAFHLPANGDSTAWPVAGRPAPTRLVRVSVSTLVRVGLPGGSDVGVDDAGEPRYSCGLVPPVEDDRSVMNPDSGTGLTFEGSPALTPQSHCPRGRVDSGEVQDGDGR
jgi:hypothetical protein